MKKNLINLLLVMLVLASCKKNVPNVPKNTNNNPPTVGNPQGGVLGEIPNAGFETWVNQNGQEIPEGWSTVFGIWDGISKTSDKHSGNYALLLETAKLPLSGIINAGGKGKVFGPSKFAYTHRPKSLNFYYKYIPSGEDEANIDISLTRWNSTTKKTEIVGKKNNVCITSTPSYIQKSILIEYANQEIPDSASVCLSSHKNPVRSPAGSKLFIDDLTFSK